MSRSWSTFLACSRSQHQMQKNDLNIKLYGQEWKVMNEPHFGSNALFFITKKTDLRLYHQMLSTIPKDIIQSSCSVKFIPIIDFIMLCVSLGIVTSDNVSPRCMAWESKILLSKYKRQDRGPRGGRPCRGSPRASRNRLHNRTNLHTYILAEC